MDRLSTTIRQYDHARVFPCASQTERPGDHPLRYQRKTWDKEGAILEIQALDGDIVLRRTPPLKGGRVVGDKMYNEILDELDDLRRT